MGGLVVPYQADIAARHATVSLRTREGREPIKGRVESFDKNAMRLELTIPMGPGNAEARSRFDISRIDTTSLTGLMHKQLGDDKAAEAVAIAAFLVLRNETATAEQIYRKSVQHGGNVAVLLDRLVDIRRLELSQILCGKTEPRDKGTTLVTYDFRDAKQLQDWRPLPSPGSTGELDFQHAVAGQNRPGRRAHP